MFVEDGLTMGEPWDNYCEMVTKYYSEELERLKSRPGWLYVNSGDKGTAYVLIRYEARSSRE
jgi:hypothetical protein